MIHLGFHKYPIAVGKCKESMRETKRLIVKKVHYIADVKIFSITLGVNNIFLTRHLFNDYNDGSMELFNGE
jgi:hypothetical protein